MENKKNLVTNSFIELGEEQQGKGKGRFFTSRFIEAGIAHYNELGDILITKETLDKFIDTMVGCPVIINHKEVTDKNADKLRVGVISRVWFNELDGWYYCEGIITDSQAIDLIKNQGWNVSCSYNFVSDNQKKIYHGKEIDQEFIDGEFLHLAIVENPRYEGANIVVNSKDGQEWISIKKNDEVIHLPLDENKKIDTKAIDDYKKAEKEIKDELTEKKIIKKADSEKPKEVNEKQGNITIKKETEKAYLLEKDNTEFWVQKRWFKDAKLTQAGEKSFEDKKEFNEMSEKLKNSYVKIKKPSWESEKAVGIDVNLDFYDVEKDKSFRIFIPKSQLKNGAVPFWLYKKKINEIVDYGESLTGMHRTMGGFMINYDGFDYSDFSDKEIGYLNKMWNNKHQIFNDNSSKEVYTIIDDELYKVNEKENKANNNIDKENIIMTAMNDLKDFILSVVNNACKNETEEEKKTVETEKEKEVENEEVDKRDIIRQIMAIASKKEASEDVKTIAKLAEKLAYDKDEAENEEEDKKEEKAENKCKAKNEADETKEEKDIKEEDEQIEEDEKVTENEDKEKEEDKKEEEKTENKCAKNSMDDVKAMVMGGNSEVKAIGEYSSQAERLELGNKF